MLNRQHRAVMRFRGGASRVRRAVYMGVVVLAVTAFAKDGPPSSPASTARIRPVILRASPHYNPSRVPPPAGVGAPRALSADITVNFNPPGGSDLVPWPTAARQAFNHAVRIWETLLNGTQTIEINAYWSTNVAPGVLGFSSPDMSYRDYASFPVAGTWYAVALANEFEGSDLNGIDPEMNTTYNADFAWYFGTDGNPGAGEYDFVTVVLHEICHGLGYTAWMDWDDGTGDDECAGVAGEGCWGDGTGYPGAYDRLVITGTSVQLITLDNPSTTLGNRLTGNNLYFDGANARAAYGGGPPRLYAPAVWDSGSSIAHLDSATFDGTSHALMTPSLDLGESAHHPGTISIGILEDIGWPVLVNYSIVYVRAGVPAPGQGTHGTPFPTVEQGTHYVADDGTVKIDAGNYPEAFTIHRPMAIERWGAVGTVTIGE